MSDVAVSDLDSLPWSGLPLLDVREPDEWQAGHAPGALHVPMSQITGRLAEVPAAAVVVCRVGGRSAQVTAWLRAQGYEAFNLSGGMLAWAGAGRPVRDDAGAPGVIV